MKRIAKLLAWVLVLCALIFMVSSCATSSSNFSQGYQEGYDSVDPACEHNWLKKCPEDGRAEYWTFWFKSEHQDSTRIIDDKVIPSATDEEPIIIEDGENDG